LTAARGGRYTGAVKRLELVRIRSCRKCGRTAAELKCDDGVAVVVPIDAHRARELADGRTPDALESLTGLLLAQLRAAGRRPSEVVLDVLDGRLRGVLAFADDEVVGCTAEEAVALAVRAPLPLFATDDAVAHATARAARGTHPGGDTVH